MNVWCEIVTVALGLRWELHLQPPGFFSIFGSWGGTPGQKQLKLLLNVCVAER